MIQKCLTEKVLLLQNGAWVCSLVHGKTNLLTPGVVKNVQTWSRCQTRSWEQLMCKNFKLTDKLQGSILKGKMRERRRYDCWRYDQLVHNSLIDWWWGNRVLSEGLTLSVLRLQLDWGLYAHGHHIVLPFGRGCNIYKTTQECVSDTVSIYIREELKILWRPYGWLV